MKKLGLITIGVFVVATLYYFTMGASQITNELKKQVNLELQSLQTQGFVIEEREIKENTEHLVLLFDNPKKIASYLTHKGIALTEEDASHLKALRIGIDIAYLPDAYAAASIDFYPISLPTSFTSSLMKNGKQQQLETIKNLLKNKTFLTHISLNKLGTEFKGYTKDIDLHLKDEKDMRIKIEGMTFLGKINHQSLQSVTQKLKDFNITVDNVLSLAAHGVKTNYLHTKNTPNDIHINYDIDTMNIKAYSQFTLEANSINIDSHTTVKNNLSSSDIKTKTEKITLTEKNKKTQFKTFILHLKANNLDMKAFEELQHIDVNNTKELNAVLQTLISKNIHIEVPTLSIDKIEADGKEIDGFNLTSKIDIKKSFSIAALQNNPTSILSAIDANLHIDFSKEIFNIITQQPKAMIALMLFQPKNVGDKKSYTLEVKDGKLIINGMSLF